MPASTDELLTRRARGVEAERLLGTCVPVLNERREFLITKAVREYKSGSFSGEKALLFVASLVEIEELRAALEHRQRDGVRAAEHLAAR